MKISEYNHLTQETIVRDATPEEIEQRKIDVANNKAQQAEAEAKAAQRQLILDKLGLTADEAKLLIG